MAKTSHNSNNSGRHTLAQSKGKFIDSGARIDILKKNNKFKSNYMQNIIKQN